MALRTRLAASEAAFFGIVERSSDGVLVVDADGIVRFANTASADMLGRPRADLGGADVGFAVVAGDVAEVELVCPGGRVTFAEIRVVDTEWEGRPCLLALLRDVTDRHQADAELAQRATHDHLTGLPNRFLLEDRLAQAVDRLNRSPGSLALFAADLDDFKSVNDRWGHAAGDLVLIEAGRRIRSILRPADSVARFGGDEFVLLCEGMNRAAAAELMARLTVAFREPIRIHEEACSIGVSVGFVLADQPGVTAETLVAAADEQMYRHKRRRSHPEEPGTQAQSPQAQSTATQSTPAQRTPTPSMSALEPLATAGPEYRFTLYTAGANARSAAARQQVERLCRNHLPAGGYHVTSVDVLRADADVAHILVTPTLVRTQPLPVLRAVGDLSGTSQVAEALGLPARPRA